MGQDFPTEKHETIEIDHEVGFSIDKNKIAENQNF